MKMKLTFLGGAEEVGGSSLLVETAGRRLLVDCGIRPSPRARWGLAGDQIPDLSLIDQGGEVDAILLTHAHTDHSGALELVTGRFPQAPVFATPPTIALVRVLHQDARRIMQSRLEEEGELPLFDDRAVERLMSAFVPAPFKERMPLGEGLAVTFFPAGHIAGAAMLGLESMEGRLLITGDLSISPQRTVDGARPPAFHPDLLVVESTYGGRLHANRQVQERRLVEAVTSVVEAGGKVLIPAFALGRAQEILLILAEAQRRGDLPAVPVWADGMVRSICAAYTSFSDYLPLALQERRASFFEGHIQPVQNQEQRNAICWEPGAAVIVASSGMLAGGPALSYAKLLARNPQHAILLTGYQDEESPGRRLQEAAERGAGTIRLGKEKVDVQCRLGVYSLSAHADEAQLVSLVETLNPGRVLLVHGDEAARLSLQQALASRGRSVELPFAGQSIETRLDSHGVGRSPKQTALPVSRRSPGTPVDVRQLWLEIAAPAGGFFTLAELVHTWWEDEAIDMNLDAMMRRMESALQQEGIHFETWRQELYHARSAGQVEITLQRRKRLDELPLLTGQWLILRGLDDTVYAARCLSTSNDRLVVRTPDPGGESQSVFPEDLLAVHGPADQVPPPSSAELDRFQPGDASLTTFNRESPQVMEPNQALAYTQAYFPPEVRLRKCGYHLGQHSLTLTFDFPDMVQEKHPDLLEQLANFVGWQVLVNPEANQFALNTLASQVLPAGWRVVKGPAIHRDRRMVSITVSFTSDEATLTEDPDTSLSLASEAFRAASGFELQISQAAVPALPTQPARPANFAGQPWEINAAYHAIKTALEGSSLYRTSLRGNEIVLSFVSKQVGERYQDQMDALALQTGWHLAINPQPNQGAILESARRLMEQSGLRPVKGPSIFIESGQVVVSLGSTAESMGIEKTLANIADQFLQQTGFHLVINLPTLTTPAPAGEVKPGPSVKSVEIPLNRIRLRPFHQSLVLDQAKLEKTIERARRLGSVLPPILVRRSGDGYILMDGLYRLRAAQALGFNRIQAEIEQ
jgi:Cft2 family RNA processing exonuclease